MFWKEHVDKEKRAKVLRELKIYEKWAYSTNEKNLEKICQIFQQGYKNARTD